MKKSTKLVILAAVLVVALDVCGFLILSRQIYRPITDVVPGLNDLRHKHCTGIELSYEDLANGQGEIKIAVKDDAEIEKMQELILQTFCRKDTLPFLVGSININVTFLFEEEEAITLGTCAYGGFRLNGQYYSTNNELGTYFTDYAMNATPGEKAK